MYGAIIMVVLKAIFELGVSLSPAAALEGKARGRVPASRVAARRR
jgi:hypothetical protein